MNKQYSKEDMPVSYWGFFQKAYNGSKANAIKAKCLDCVCFQRKEITLCTVVSCPLHNVRPYQENPPKKRKKKNTEITQDTE